MLAYAAGDTAAFDVLYGRHENVLYRFVRRLMGVRFAPEVDEVFQETWMRIVAARESFAPQGATWRTWAFTIAHNLAIDRLRMSGREVAYYAHDDDEGDALESDIFRRDDGPSEDGAAHPSAEEVAFWRAAGRRMLECLEELPEEQRAAFLLHNEGGLSIAALSATLDINFETVRSRLRYGLKKLRTCMEQYLPHLEGQS